MSSVRNIAAALPYLEPCDSVPPSAHCRPVAARAVLLEEPWQAALNSAACPTHPNAMAYVWEDLARGRLRPVREITTHDRMWLVAETTGQPSGLSPEDASLVVSVLCGEPRKALASELGIAVSTAAGRVLRALAKLQLADRNVGLPLVLAAQSWAGFIRIPSAKSEPFDHDGDRCVAVGIPRPSTNHLTALTRGEQQIAQWLIEGLTRYEIAERRETSVYTVSRQFHSVFAALRVTGRYALIRRAAELGCFHELRAPDSDGHDEVK